jgi:hypothetical protein
MFLHVAGGVPPRFAHLLVAGADPTRAVPWLVSTSFGGFSRWRPASPGIGQSHRGLVYFVAPEFANLYLISIF